jgi:hypothetical protein
MIIRDHDIATGEDLDWIGVEYGIRRHRADLPARTDAQMRDAIRAATRSSRKSRKYEIHRILSEMALGRIPDRFAFAILDELELSMDDRAIFKKANVTALNRIIGADVAIVDGENVCLTAGTPAGRLVSADPSGVIVSLYAMHGFMRFGWSWARSHDDKREAAKRLEAARANSATLPESGPRPGHWSPDDTIFRYAGWQYAATSWTDLRASVDAFERTTLETYHPDIGHWLLARIASMTNMPVPLDLAAAKLRERVRNTMCVGVLAPPASVANFPWRTLPALASLPSPPRDVVKPEVTVKGSPDAIRAAAASVPSVTRVREVVTVEPGIAGVTVELRDGWEDSDDLQRALVEVRRKVIHVAPAGVEFRIVGIVTDGAGRERRIACDAERFADPKFWTRTVAHKVRERELARRLPVQTEADADTDNFADAPSALSIDVEMTAAER